MNKQKLLCLMVLIVAISGCMGNEPQVNATATVNQTPRPTPTNPFPVYENSTVYVEIRGSEFDPATLIVVNGTTVKWTNWDSAYHTVHGDRFESPPLYSRDSWNYTFNDTGAFEYNCSNHSYMPHGWIIVE